MIKTFAEPTIDSELIFAGKIIKVRLDTVRLPDQKITKREIVEHPGAVAIVPLTDDGEVILIKQYRKAVEQILWEIPAGKLEENEDPEDCARRELIEETGYEAGKLLKLASICTSPGFANEIIHLYLARELKSAEQRLDEDEFIELHKISLQQAKQMVLTGEIQDAKSIVGILLALN